MASQRVGHDWVTRLNWMQEMWVWALGWEDPLEEEMAIHSSILAWKIPWTEEPGGLQSMGSQSVRHSWSDLAHTHTMAAWPGQGLEQKVMPLIHVLDWTQIPPIIHEFLTLIIRWSRQEDCEGLSTHSSLLPEKGIKFYGPQPQHEDRLLLI